MTAQHPPLITLDSAAAKMGVQADLGKDIHFIETSWPNLPPALIGNAISAPPNLPLSIMLLFPLKAMASTLPIRWLHYRS